MPDTETLTRPAAAENRAWVRARLAGRGWEVREKTLNAYEAHEWLRAQGFAVPDVLDVISMISGKPRRMAEGTGWRLKATRSWGWFDLLTIEEN